MLYRRLAYLPDRRSTRIAQNIPIVISGLDASGGAYYETVSTVSISCHGCRYWSQNRVAVGDVTILEVLGLDARREKSPTLARVRSVKQLSENPASYDVAVELDSPQNVWGVACPPLDWAEFEPVPAPGEATPKLRIHALPTFELRRAEGWKRRRTPAAPVTIRKVLVDPEGAALAPLPPHLTSTLREPAKPTPIQPVKTLPLARTSRDSFDGVCSKLEKKVSQIFETLIASFATEMASRSKQVDPVSFEAFEGSVCAFEPPAANSTRRLA